MLELIYQLESDIEAMGDFVEQGRRMVVCDRSRNLVNDAEERVRLMRVTLAQLRVAANKSRAQIPQHDYTIVPFLNRRSL
jgi:ABC-type uncharacterized transport system auxiliary subunit